MQRWWKADQKAPVPVEEEYEEVGAVDQVLEGKEGELQRGEGPVSLEVQGA